MLTNRQYAYARVYEGKACITILNNDEQEAQLNLRLPFAGTTCRDLITGEPVDVSQGSIAWTIPGNSAAVLRLE